MEKNCRDGSSNVIKAIFGFHSRSQDIGKQLCIKEKYFGLLPISPPTDTNLKIASMTFLLIHQVRQKKPWLAILYLPSELQLYSVREWLQFSPSHLQSPLILQILAGAVINDKGRMNRCPSCFPSMFPYFPQNIFPLVAFTE